ncbi:MAG: ABC transporter ATP-binding protein [Aliiglaciecola sp.]
MLAVESIGKHYSGKAALQSVSFGIQPGEIVALLGANGSGKTTTINSICNLIDFELGDIRFEGISIRKDKSYLAQIGAVLGGSRNINWRLTASQNAQYFAALRGYHGKALKARIAELEDQLGLAQYAKLEVLKLSTGNKQKASLLSALSYSPKLLLLDEPTLGLDFKTVGDLQQIILEQSQQHQQGYLITSHDMSFIDKICQKVVVIDQGQVIFNGSIESLKQKLFAYRMVINLPVQDHLSVSKSIEELCFGHYHIEQTQEGFNIQYETPDQVLALLSWLHTSNKTIGDLTMTELSMEEAYKSLTTGDQEA